MTSVNLKHPGQAGVWASALSDFDGTNGTYPSVPYTKDDFHNAQCNENIRGEDYNTNAWRVRMCRLSNLIDLDHGRVNVQEKIADYMNRLIDLGVAGFRIDAVKHMWPADLENILKRLKTLRSDLFGESTVTPCTFLFGRGRYFENFFSDQRPFIVHEVMDWGNEAVKSEDYLKTGRLTNFKYGLALAAAVRKQNQNFRGFGNFGPEWGFLADTLTLNFIDNHDTQRDNNLGALTYKNGQQYIMANTFMLAWPYGYPSVMSSFNFTNKDTVGGRIVYRCKKIESGAVAFSGATKRQRPVLGSYNTRLPPG